MERPSLPRGKPILSFVSTVWARRAYQDLIVRNPESLQLYALIYKSLLRNGFDVSESSRSIQRVVDEFPQRKGTQDIHPLRGIQVAESDPVVIAAA